MTTIDPAGGTPAPQKQKAKKGDGLAAKRVNDLLKLFRYRHPDGLPDDGNGYGRKALYALVALAMHLTKQRAAKLAEIYKLAPWALESVRDDLERQALVDRWWPSLDELGAMFGVTKEERYGLEIFSIGAVDESPKERKAAEAEKQRKRSREARLRKRAARAGEATKPTARDREARLLLELRTTIAVKDLVEQVRHLREFKGKDPGRSVHKTIDTLKARGLVMDEIKHNGRKPERWVRKSTAAEQRAAVAATTTSATASCSEDTVADTGSGDAAEYFERLRVKLETFTKYEDIASLGGWFRSPAERAFRARRGLTADQLAQAHGMINDRLHQISGKKTYFGWSRPS